MEAAVAAGGALTPPYQLPCGMHAYGERMILLNARLDLSRTRARLHLAAAAEQVNIPRNRIMDCRRSNGLFEEVIPGRGEVEDTLLRRHRTPGHALEDLWMLAHADELTGQDHGGNLTASALVLCELSWDAEEGGFFRCVDQGRGKPRGRPVGGDYERLVRGTWSTKLWWVHSEAFTR